MKKFLRYGIVLLVMIALAFPMLYSTRTIIKRSLHKLEMLQELEQFPMASIILPVKQVQWFEKGREIIVNNRMFDVKSWKVAGDSAIFHGLWDDKETALNKIIRKTEEKKKEQQSVFKFQQLISSWYCTEKNDPDFLAPQTSVSNFTGYIKSPFETIVISLPKPPPELS